MGLVTDLLLFPLLAPVKGMHFIQEQLRAEADEMMLDERQINADILELEIRHDQGEVSDEDFEAQETELLQTLSFMRSRQYEYGRDE